VFTELISIDGLREQDEIGIPIQERFYFGFGQRSSDTIFPEIGNREIVIVCWEQEGDVGLPMIASEIKGRWKLRGDYHEHRVHDSSESYTLANVLNEHCGLVDDRFFGDLGKYDANLYPRSLVNPKILVLIEPQHKRDNGIDHSKWNCYENFKKHLPPLHGLIPALWGLAGIWWGGWNLRWGRRLPWSGISFLLGIILWGIACVILLRWSVEAF
jgi:hypothetical protein